MGGAIRGVLSLSIIDNKDNTVITPSTVRMYVGSLPENAIRHISIPNIQLLIDNVENRESTIEDPLVTVEVRVMQLN